MSDHAHDISKHVRAYLIVFGALLLGTVLTVLAARWDLGSDFRNITLALIIATVKAFLVAGYFMHLLSERTTIYAIMIATVFFFVGLMFLTLFAYNDYPVKSIMQY